MLVMEKIGQDLPQLVYDESSLSHLIDEVLLFDSEIRNTYSYPPMLPGCLDVLCLPEALTKWLLVEKKCKNSTFFILSNTKTFTVFLYLLNKMLQI